MKKKLIPVKENGSPANFTTKNRDMLCPAKINIHFVRHVLVISYANIWGSR
jgi:hypothetical protein